MAVLRAPLGPTRCCLLKNLCGPPIGAIALLSATRSRHRPFKTSEPPLPEPPHPPEVAALLPPFPKMAAPELEALLEALLEPDSDGIRRVPAAGTRDRHVTRHVTGHVPSHVSYPLPPF